MGKLGMICVPRTAGLALEMARAAEEAGLWGIGIGDSQALCMDAYAVTTACLLRTKRLHLGPIVTNPVTRHWTVHAAAARTLSELAPGRFVLGMASGNSSVRAIGLPPARLERFEQDLRLLRPELPPGVPLLVAADGPRMAALAGRCADGLIIGAGIEPEAIASLRAACVSDPSRNLELWLAVHLLVVEREEELPAAEAHSVGVAISMAHRALGNSFEGKHVPPEFQPVLRERLARYDMAYHAATGANPNAALLSDRPDVERYLSGRFTITGTRDMCRQRLAATARETGIENFWFSAVVADPVRNARLAGEAFQGMTERTHGI